MAAAGTIPKPQIRRLLERNIKRALVGATLTSIGSGLLWKMIVMDPKKKAYAEFYKTYDADAKFEEMCNSGVLPVCATLNGQERNY